MTQGWRVAADPNTVPTGGRWERGMDDAVRALEERVRDAVRSRGLDPVHEGAQFKVLLAAEVAASAICA